jgi:hypothetical protein
MSHGRWYLASLPGWWNRRPVLHTRFGTLFSSDAPDSSPASFPVFWSLALPLGQTPDIITSSRGDLYDSS